jgi:hypothetical protein
MTTFLIFAREHNDKEYSLLSLLFIYHSPSLFPRTWSYKGRGEVIFLELSPSLRASFGYEEKDVLPFHNLLTILPAPQHKLF